jgi:hypothetical protein
MAFHRIHHFLLTGVPHFDLVVNAARIDFMTLLRQRYRSDGVFRLNEVNRCFLSRIPDAYASIVAAAQ